MTTVIKVGGSSQSTFDNIQRIVDQSRELDDNLVYAISAQGKTTDRIDEAIERAKRGERTEPEYVFQELESMYGTLQLEGYEVPLRDGIYQRFSNLPQEAKNKRKNGFGEPISNLDDPSYSAFLHLSGERLAAAAFAHILEINGIKSTWIDFHSTSFPLVVSGDYRNARIDLEESRKKASWLTSGNGHKPIVLPAYGGVEVENPEGMPRFKTLGRGGSDTAAFGYLYAFEGNALWILTDVNGILTANFEGGVTVPELNLAEAKDSGTLGAKLPGRRSLHGAEQYFREGAAPSIFLAHGQDINGPKTSIVYKTTERVPVKLVAGRDVVQYVLEGDLRGLHNKLEESGM